MILKCCIIDDEPDAVEILADYIQQIPDLSLITKHTDPVEALAKISESDTHIDIVFMDVDMPRISGIDLSRSIRDKVGKLVFTTAHTKYAFDAFEVEADAYLLKPFTFAKFALTINKLINEEKRIEKNVSNIYRPQELFIKTTEERNKFVKINIKDIMAIEGFKNYVKIYTTSETLVTYLTLKEMGDRLSNLANFIQIHRSFIISTRHIEKIEGSLVKLPNDLLIPVGTFYKDTFHEYLARHTIKTGR